MAKATLSDGQFMYAVNDLFIGPKSHTSARYELCVGLRSEIQSSSGIIVSTGLGSTAWMKSIMTGSLAVTQGLGGSAPPRPPGPLPWDTPYLCFAVREPFPSAATKTTLVFGTTDIKTPMKVMSLMPEHGVIFSDGIEKDFVAFNSGIEATISVSERVGHLVL